MDEAQERLFVLTDVLVEIDLRNGNRVAHAATATGLGLAATMVFDAVNGYVLGVSSAFTLVAMDPVSNEVVLVSH